MPKIPRGLTDKDMVKNYVEEATIESQLLTAEKNAERRKQLEEAEAPPAPLAKAGFTKELTEKLGMELLALKIELSNSGVKSYNLKVKRDGEKITCNFYCRLRADNFRKSSQDDSRNFRRNADDSVRNHFTGNGDSPH